MRSFFLAGTQKSVSATLERLEDALAEKLVERLARHGFDVVAEDVNRVAVLVSKT
jgi:hypothetical protein